MSAEPDVEIAVTVRAEEVRFECEPRADVRVRADGPADVEWVSERHNLPDRVEPEVTYRDIEVTWRVSARLHDLEF